jgi:hypothetical protein
MNVRNFGRIMFIIVPIFMILGVIFNIALYNECKKDGYSTFACVSMLNKGNYVIVDMADGNR